MTTLGFSTIPAAVDGLLAVLKSASGLKGVAIIDGQPTTETPPDFVAVGFAEDAGSAINGEQEPAALGNLRRSETYRIDCQVSAWNGTTVMKSCRDRAFQMLDAIAAAVRADGTLGGAVTFADFGGRFDVAQMQTQQGAVVTVNFTVDVKITRI